MKAYRCVFTDTVCEVRAEQVDARRWVARTYVVQEGSLLLQPCPCNGVVEFEGDSEADVVAQAISALCQKLGRPRRAPAAIRQDPAFRVVGRARTA